MSDLLNAIPGMSLDDTKSFLRALDTALAELLKREHGKQPFIALPQNLFEYQKARGIDPERTTIHGINVHDKYANTGSFCILMNSARSFGTGLAALHWEVMETYPFPWNVRDESDFMDLPDLRKFQSQLHAVNRANGWWENPNNNATNFMLMVSELAEAMEWDRKGNKSSDHIPEFSGIEEELADVMIRILDFGAGNKLDVVGAMIAKVRYNATRSHRHGGKAY